MTTNKYTGAEIKDNDVIISIKGIQYSKLDGQKAEFKPLVGARKFSAKPQSSSEEIYGDGRLYCVINSLSSIDLSSEFIKIGRTQKVDIWNYVYDDTTGALVTDGNRDANEVAILVKVQYKSGTISHLLYPKVQFERLENSVETAEKTAKPQFTSVAAKSIPVEVDGMSVPEVEATDPEKMEEFIAKYVVLDSQEA